MSFLSRVQIDAGQPRGREALVRLAHGAYAEHQVLWTLWGARPDAQRDFLFRRLDTATPSFYLLSAMPPVGDEGWRIETKPFSPQLSAGQTLAFDLRANPVVTRRVDGHARRHDVICDALRAENGTALPQAQVEREAGLAWLRRQAERVGFDFDPDEVRTGAYRQETVGKRGAPKPIRYSTLDFGGRLTVTDPLLFQSALMAGLGKAKAFGCGLLLVRRA